MRYSDKFLLLHIGEADAYAIATEYLDPQDHGGVLEACLKFERYVGHPVFRNPGRYTDDTEMSIANAIVLIENDPPFTREMFADAYVREFEFGGRRKGYARRFQEFLESINDGQEFLEKIRSNSDKNGAAMRAVPFGVLPRIEDVLGTATLQASLTHDTPVGRFSARAVALMAHFAFYEPDPLYLAPEWCLAYLPPDDVRQFSGYLQDPWVHGAVRDLSDVPLGLSTVQAVASLLRQQSSLMGILRQAIEWGGDTDSTAAVAWGIASPRFQKEQLPKFLEDDLEGGPESRTGARRLLALGEALMEKYA